MGQPGGGALRPPQGNRPARHRARTDGRHHRLYPGEYVAIMGASGSGKSTMLNLLGCLDRPTSGQYHLGDRDVARLDDDELSEVRSRYIGFIFQSYNLIPQYTVTENIQLPLDLPGERGDHRGAARAHTEMARMVGPARPARPPAHAALRRPAAAGRDRPLAGQQPLHHPRRRGDGNLDTKTSHEIMEMLGRLNDAGKTIIMVTHEDDIAEHAKRIIRMRDGAIVDDGPSLRMQVQAEVGRNGRISGRTEDRGQRARGKGQRARADGRLGVPETRPRRQPGATVDGPSSGIRRPTSNPAIRPAPPSPARLLCPLPSSRLCPLPSSLSLSLCPLPLPALCPCPCPLPGPGLCPFLDRPLPWTLLAALKLGMKSLLLHKLRSGLTVLGIVFGVAAVISMLAVAEGSSRDALRASSNSGRRTSSSARSNRPMSRRRPAAGRRSILNYGLKYDDFDKIMATVPTIKKALPIREIRKQIRHLDKYIDGRVVGHHPRIRPVQPPGDERGRFLTRPTTSGS